MTDAFDPDAQPEAYPPPSWAPSPPPGGTPGEGWGGPGAGWGAPGDAWGAPGEAWGGPAPGAGAAPPSRPRRRPAGIVAVSVAVVALLVAGVVAVTAMTGPAANTPEDAVRGLLSAAGNGDALGVLDHVDPAERDGLTSFMTNGTQDLARLGVLAPGIDLHHVPGVSATFTVEATHTDLRPGLATVEVTGGTVHLHVDASQLPLGPFVRQHAGKALDAVGVKDTSSPLHLHGAIATVQRRGTWYVSLGYTVAEAARRRANLPLPDAAAAVPAVGAPTAEGAVDDFLHAMASLDVQRLVELTPPDEMQALHEYAPLFLPKVKDDLARAGSVSIAITSLSLAGAPVSGGELVTVKSIGLHASVGGRTLDLAPGQKCPTITGGTPADISGVCGTARAGQQPPGVAGVLNSLRGAKPQVGFIAVQEGGSWYVSPTRTVLDDLEAVLHALPSDFLTTVARAFNPGAVLGSLHVTTGALTPAG
ncbi:MAG TPA: hypothetical protein VMU14_24335, partial [Acidimicrobiales bacterium]|nr:hypothetical protein [Acidimicrobiales bacterium]